MIKINIKQNTITIKGHAEYDKYGQDIVCASVSSIITTTVNNMHSIDKDSFKYIDNGKEVIIKLIKENDIILKLFNNLIILLKSLEKDYKKNIKIESEE